MPEISVPESVSTFNEYADKIFGFIKHNPHVLSCADAFLLDWGTSPTRTGVLIAVLAGIRRAPQNLAFERYLALVLPDTNLDKAKAEIFEAFKRAYSLLAGRELTTEESDNFAKIIQVQNVQDKGSQSVDDLIRVQPDFTAVLVLSAAKFRDPSVLYFVAPGAETPVRAEDVWAPQFHALVCRANEAVKGRYVYVALDADEAWPSRPELRQQIESIPGGVLGGANEASLDSILNQHADEWNRWARAGQLGMALASIDALPSEFNDNKAFLKIQVMHSAGLPNEALALIRSEMPKFENVQPAARVKLARIASDAGASGLVLELLKPALTELSSLEEFESAITTLEMHDFNDEATEVAAKLSEVFPNSQVLKDRHRRRLWTAKDYRALHGLAEAHGDPRAVRLFQHLSQFLTVAGVPNYAAMIGAVNEDDELRNTLLLYAIDDALEKGLLSHAAELALSVSGRTDLEPDTCRRLLAVLEAVLLSSRDLSETIVSKNDLKALVIAVSRTIARRRDTRQLRIKLSAVLQPELAGSWGLALLAISVLELATVPLLLRAAPTIGNGSVLWLKEHDEFFSALFTWISGQSPVILGRISAPAELVTEPADDAIDSITRFLQWFPIEDVSDLDVLQKWMAVGVTMSAYASDPNSDIKLMRIAAQRFSTGGFTQQGRDLAEHILVHCDQTPERRRLSNFAVADTYNRTGDSWEALIALAVTFASETELIDEEAYHQIVGLARVLRDLGLVDQAMRAVRKARVVLKRMELEEEFGHRLVTLELQLDIALHRDENGRNGDFARLFATAIGFSNQILDVSGELEPIAAVLANLLRQARETSAANLQSGEDVFSKLLDRMSGKMKARLSAIAAPIPTPEMLLEYLLTSAGSRYSGDVGFDTWQVASLAIRTLSDQSVLADATSVSFVLDVLADRGVATPGWDEAAEPPPAPGKISDALDNAVSISTDGLSVIQFGWTSAGAPVRLDCKSRMSEVATSDMSGPTEAAFDHWVPEFPYQYGVDEKTANLFFTTTEDFQFRVLPNGPVVFIGEVKSQAFPPNLIRIGDNFAGQVQPMSAAPSLAWLKAAQGKDTKNDGRRLAWISSADLTGQTLAIMTDRLAPTFEAHRFELDRSLKLPARFAGAEMAIVAAHGGINAEEGYFRVVSDEGILNVSSQDLANSLRNVSVVILFVCSAGRTDKHPTANTAVGLAKRILDRGCSVVIASPWPLDSAVPAHWLPAFMEHWDSGMTAIEANFHANQVVAKWYSDSPAACLAMSVYGNPIARRQAGAEN